MVSQFGQFDLKRSIQMDLHQTCPRRILRPAITVKGKGQRILQVYNFMPKFAIFLTFCIVLVSSSIASSISGPRSGQNMTNLRLPALSFGEKTFIEKSNASISDLEMGYANRSARRSVASGGIFTIVTFDNVPCNSSSGEVGICYTSRECSNHGGAAGGLCAGNYGICCVLTASCDNTVVLNQTYFVQPSYPQSVTGPLSCTLTVTPIAGLFLDLIDFQIDGPDAGTCGNDTFSVSVTGVSSTYPILCGNNVGQMAYIDLAGGSSVKLTFNLGTSSSSRSWKIRMVHLKANDICAAPPGCFQYYQGSSGVIQSFNYNGGMGQYLNNFCYNMCFGLSGGYCNLLLTETTFMLNGMSPSDCSGDFILANGNQFCGDTLDNGMLVVNRTSGSNFIAVQACSDGSNTDMDSGFNLNYNLIPCTAAG